MIFVLNPSGVQEKEMGKGIPRTEKAMSLSSGQDTGKPKATQASDNSNCAGVQKLMVIIDKVIQQADDDSQFSAADLIGFFCQDVMVQDPSLVLPGTVIRFTGSVGHSSKLLEILAATFDLQRQKVSGSYQKWVKPKGHVALCHWALDNSDKDGNSMHQSFHSVFTQCHQRSIFFLSGEKLHRVKGFEQFITCSVHFPFREEEKTECSIAVSTKTSTLE